MPTNIFKSDEALLKYITILIMFRNARHPTQTVVYKGHRECREGLSVFLHPITRFPHDSYVRMDIPWEDVIDDMKNFRQ